MRVSFLLIVLLFLTCNLLAQTPGIKWQKSAGGSALDYLNQYSYPHSPNKAKRLITASGSFIIAGTVMSGDGDAITNHVKNVQTAEAADVFVGETDSSGNWLWKKTYGGTSKDEFQFVLPAIDGGIIVAATTVSNDGDVNGNHGQQDIWLFHLDDKGNILWSKCYGGSSGESEGYLCQDGTDGYAFVGSTYSNDGDLTNHHGTTGNLDIMLMRIGLNGDIRWCKNYGGSASDYGTTATVGTDGHIYVGGFTESNDGDFTLLYPYSGYGDLCLFSTDKDGNLLWKKSYGGSETDWVSTVTLTVKDTLLVSGTAYSSDGDVVGKHEGGGDGWLFKVNSGNGNLLWQQCYGGNGNDGIYGLKVLDDQSIITAGFSESTDLARTNNHGYEDIWVSKIGSNGELIWQKQFGGTNGEKAGAVDMAIDSSIVVLGQAFSNDQDVINPYATTPDGDGNIWFLKLGKTNTITGNLYFDYNHNQLQDSIEGLVEESQDVIAVEGADTVRAHSFHGYYSLDLDTGLYRVSTISNIPYYKSQPVEKEVFFSSYYNVDSLSFAYQADINAHDMMVSIIPLDNARPGFTIPYKILYKNRGTDTVNYGVITFIKDAKFSYQDFVSAYDSLKGDTAYWSFHQQLKPNDTASITVRLRLTTSAVAGDSVLSFAFIEPYTNDAFTDDNSFRLNQTIRSSHDPNDKSESHGRYLSMRDYSNNDYLTYTIRFQNTGTYTAYNIVVRDTLDNRLDPNTFEMISCSHNYQFMKFDTNKIGWFFNYVYLPDSTTNEVGSHGYITFRIKLKKGLLPGDSITNAAGIYFDYNPVVMTNTVTTFINADNVLPVIITNLKAVNEGSLNRVQWTTSQEINIASFILEKSEDGVHFSALSPIAAAGSNMGDHLYNYNDEAPYKGKTYYRIKVLNRDNTIFYTNTVFATYQLTEKYVIIPNPVKDILTLKVNSNGTKTLNLSVANTLGEVLLLKKVDLSSSTNTVFFNVSSFANGAYFLNIVSGDNRQTLRFIKMNH